MPSPRWPGRTSRRASECQLDECTVWEAIAGAFARIGALAGKLAATALEQSGWLAAERSAQALLRKIAICIGWEPGLVPGVRPVLVVQY